MKVIRISKLLLIPGDPVFYRWHSYIDDIFQEHKQRLTPYTETQLNYNGITVTGVQVAPERGPVNTFQTFWQQSDVDLSRGMDFVTARGNVTARFTHLNHTPFSYTIQVNNSGGAQRMGMVRIFMAPKTDERGNEMLFRDQRLMMIELDKFVVSLRPGQNTVRRRSTESTVTIPFERTFRSLEESRPEQTTDTQQQFNFCGCGWPHHMLVPKGLPEGLTSQLFVMISNYDDDRVEQDLSGVCNDAASYCGVRDRKYPDRKPMGYPFDRLPRANSDRLSSFLTPNMTVQDCTIVHSNTTTSAPARRN
jgi:tyrosinase